MVGAFSPAGGIMASGADMAKWMLYLLNEGVVNSRRKLVEPSTIHQMFDNLNRDICRSFSNLL